MRKILTAIILLMLCCVLCIGVGAMGVDHTDPLSGMRFVLPDGWDKMFVVDGDPSVTWFVAEDDNVPAITFFSMDAYAKEAPKNLKEAMDRIPGDRISYDNSKLPIEAFAKELGIDETALTTVVLNGREYFCMEAMLPSANSIDPSTILLREENGIIYAFRFWETMEHPGCSVFLDMVANAEYPIYSMDEKTTVLREVLIILISFMLHWSPIAVFRYGIRKAPIENAKEVCIIYGIGAVLVGWILGGFLDVANIGMCAVGIAVGGYLNYRMLCK